MGVLELQDGDSDEQQVGQLFTWTYINQTTSWLMRDWNIFGARTNHRHPRIHKIHHSPELEEAITFPLIIFSVINHRGYIQMSFSFENPKLGIPKFPKLELSAFWKAIISCANL
jgi:hypothetical protein